MYKVLVMFTDLTDGNYRYEVGDTYPREGLKPSADRIIELSTTSNKRGLPLIEEIKKETKEPKETKEAKETKEKKAAPAKTTKKSTKK